MNDMPASSLDSRAVRRAFDRASRSYDATARLQAEVRGELLARLPFFKLSPRMVVDIGAGTGAAAVELKRRFPRAEVVALDLAPGMLAQVKRRSRPWRRLRGVCADARALPLAAQSVDLIFSSLMLQWCDPPLAALAEWQRVLRPGGLALFSSFGPETLAELRLAWAEVDRGAHVSEFVPAPLLAAAAQQAGLAEPVLDTETLVRHVTDARSLMRELKDIGAQNARLERARGLTSPARLRALEVAYDRHRDARGLPVSWEVIYGAAFADGGARHAPVSPRGETVIPLASLRRRSRP